MSTEINKDRVILEATDVVRQYTQSDEVITAVNRASMKVYEGEFIAIVGASGSGKSTLLHLLAGMDRPQAGHILIRGQDITAMSADELGRFRGSFIGMVFQSHNLIPQFTALENILIPTLMCHKEGASYEEMFKKLVVADTLMVAVKTIVTTEMAVPICEKYGVELRNVLTGFKFIGEQIGLLEQEGHPERYIFGFEESCGYLKGTYARDKDAVVASMLVCEMAASLKREGKTILDALDALYAKFGYYLAYVQSIELTGADAMEKAAKMMADLRSNVPATIGGATVSDVRDYKTSIAKNLDTGAEEVINLPKSNVLEFILGGQGSVIARPSGTEPKVKFYYTAVGQTKADAKVLLDAMVKQMSV